LSHTGRRDLAQFWRIDVDASQGGIVFENNRGWLIDVGERVVAREGNDVELGAMLEIARVKGWESVEFTGDDGFKRRAMRAALRRGLSVHAEGDDRKILEAEFAWEQRRREARPAGDQIGSRHIGVIEAIDEGRVYQRVGGELLSHKREVFGEDRADELELAIGQEMEIGYDFDGPTLGPSIEVDLDLPSL